MNCARALFTLISAALPSLFASFGATDGANDATNQDNFDTIMASAGDLSTVRLTS